MSPTCRKMVVSFSARMVEGVFSGFRILVCSGYRWLFKHPLAVVVGSVAQYQYSGRYLTYFQYGCNRIRNQLTRRYLACWLLKGVSY